MDLKEKTVKKNYIYKGKIVNLRQDDAVLPDGRPCKREVIEHPGGASVLYVEDGKILLVKQFRYCYGEETYEIPAGKLNYGEDPAATAARELEEEAGVIADGLTHLYTIYPTPGYTNEKIYIYRADSVRQGKVHLDEGEFLNALYVPVTEALAMISDGRIKDSKTIIAIQRYVIDEIKK